LEEVLYVCDLVTGDKHVRGVDADIAPDEFADTNL